MCKGTAIITKSPNHQYCTGAIILHCALSLIGPVSAVWVCLFVWVTWVCGWVCYHNNSKLRAFSKQKQTPNWVCRCRWWPSPADWILAVLRLRGGGLRRGEIFWLRLTGRLHGPIVGPTGRSDWSVRPVGWSVYTFRSSDRPVGPTQATSDCLSDQSDRRSDRL